VMRGHNIWHKHYKTTRQDNFSFDRLYIHHDISIQTLTKLDLQSNQISAEGAQHLAQALQNNAVRQVLFRSTVYSLWYFNTDTHYTRSSVEPDRCWRGTTSGTSITEKRGNKSSHSLDCIFTMIFQYRHSSRSILSGTRLVLKGHNIWLKHYKTTGWDKFSFDRLHIHHDIAIQTLTTLDLVCNNISDEGVQNLAQALQNNTVRKVLLRSTVYSPCYFNTDTHHARSSGKQDRWWRGTISGTSITEQHGETSSFSIDCIFTMIFQYRHSPRCIFAGTISVMKDYKIWHKHYKTTRWDKFSLDQLYIHHVISI
jgi:hypothetical protein